MKKIHLLNICIFALLQLCILTACSSDDLVGTGSYTSSVTIVSQNVCFDAPASQGTIEFKAPGSATVSTTADWCTASLSGNTVSVSVPQNDGLTSRACNVVIKCGADSARVNVVQNGYIFELSAGTSVTTNSDAAQTLTYDLNSNLTFAFTTEADWITINGSEGKLHLTLSENTTGHIRQAWLYYTSGTLKDSLKVTQYDYDNDIAGNAYLYYYNSAGKLYRTAIVIGDESYSMPSYAKYGDWNIPFAFDSESLNFNFTNAQYCGMYSNTYYVGDCMFNSTYGYVTYYKGVSWDAPIDYWAEDGYMEADMTDNGSWSYPFEGFYLRAFSSETFSSTTNKGSILTFFYPFIVRFDPTSSAKANIPARLKDAIEITSDNVATMLNE